MKRVGQERVMWDYDLHGLMRVCELHSEMEVGFDEEFVHVVAVV